MKNRDNRITSIEAVSIYSHTAEEVSTNCAPEAFLHKVAVHNPYDANASWVRVAPLLREGTVGTIIVDNGDCMSGAVGKNKNCQLVGKNGMPYVELQVVLAGLVIAIVTKMGNASV